MCCDNVIVSGGLISRMSYMTGSANHDSTGVFFGKFVNNTTLTMNDNENMESSTQIANIHSYYVMNCLPLDVEKELEHFLPKCNQVIVGWFVCRKNSKQLMSIREHQLHFKVVERIAKSQQQINNLIFFGLFTTDESSTSFRLEFSFLSIDLKNIIRNIPYKLVNLTNQSVQSYKRSHILDSLSHSNLQKKILELERHRNMFSENVFAALKNDMNITLKKLKEKEKQIQKWKEESQGSKQ